MAKFDATDDGQPEPTGPTWKFFAAYFGGIVLAAVGIVAAVSVTSEQPGERPSNPDAGSPDSRAAGPTLPRFPGRLTLDCEFSDIPRLSGDLTGWVIRRSPGKPRIGRYWQDLCRLGDGSVQRTVELNSNIASAHHCSPSGDLLISFYSNEVRALRPDTDRATRFTPYPGEEKPAQWGYYPRVEFYRALDGDRVFTAHSSGAFDTWTAEGVRVSGQPADPKAKIAGRGLAQMAWRFTALTPDAKLFVRENADGFSVFDTATVAEVLKTDPVSGLEKAAPLSCTSGTAIRTDGTRIAALLLFGRDIRWLVVFDGKTGKTVSAVKLQTNEVFDRLSGPMSWWGDRYVIFKDGVYDTTDGRLAAHLNVGRTTGLPQLLRDAPDDRLWVAVECEAEFGHRCTILALDPPAKFPKRQYTVVYNVGENGLQANQGQGAVPSEPPAGDPDKPAPPKPPGKYTKPLTFKDLSKTHLQPLLVGGEDGFLMQWSLQESVIELHHLAEGTRHTRTTTIPLKNGFWSDVSADGNTLLIRDGQPAAVTTYRLNSNTRRQFHPYASDPNNHDPKAPVMVAAWLLPGDRVLTVDHHGGADVWSLDGKRLAERRSQSGGPPCKYGTTHSINFFGLSADRSALAICNGRGFTVLDPLTLKVRIETVPVYEAGQPADVRGVFLSPDGKRLVALSVPEREMIVAPLKQRVTVFDLTTGKVSGDFKDVVYYANRGGGGTEAPKGHFWGDHYFVESTPSQTVFDLTEGKIVARILTHEAKFDPRAQANIIDGPGERLWLWSYNADSPGQSRLTGVRPPERDLGRSILRILPGKEEPVIEHDSDWRY